MENGDMKDRKVGTIVDGKYRLDARVGRGGMGTIYRATHVMLEKTVAVKLIGTNLETSPEFVARFQREARAASNLDHPNIVSVHDLGQADDGALYLAMEYLDGSNLKDIIETTGRIEPDRIVALLGQVAGALSAAHHGGIVHRDLKPHNVMVTPGAGGAEVAKLLDFGIAKTFDEAETQLTVTGASLGTPQYMSPEQAGGQTVDSRSDLYSLGIILYEMLVGEVPFTAPSTAAVLVKHLNEPSTRPSVRRPDLEISAPLEAVALRCLAKDPTERFQTADEFIAALAQVRRAPVAAVGLGVAAAAIEAAPPAKALPVGGADLPPPSAFQGVTSAPGRQTGDVIVGDTRSRGSTLMPMLVLLFLIGGVGAAAYALGYLSSSEAAPSKPVSTEAAVPDPAPSVASNQGDEPAEITSAAAQPPVPVAPQVEVDPPTAGAPPPAAVVAESTDAGAGQAPAQAEEPFPDSPSVSLYCEGARVVCAALHSAVDRELARHAMPSVGDPDAAEILIDAMVSRAPARGRRGFGTNFVVRSFMVAFRASARRLPQAVPVPPPRMFSFDERIGHERLNEQSRLMAMAIVERVRGYWTEHAAR